MPIASCLCREWFGLQTAWNLSCSQHALSYSVPVRSLRIRATLLGVFNCGRRWQNADGRVRQMAERCPDTSAGNERSQILVPDFKTA